MADINITGTGNFSANDYNVPSPVAGQTKVSFHSANATSVVCFDNANTFGVTGVTVDVGVKKELTIQAAEDTGFTCNQQGTNCTQGNPKAGPGYTITMGGGVGGKHHHKS